MLLADCFLSAVLVTGVGLDVMLTVWPSARLLQKELPILHYCYSSEFQ